MEKREPMDVLSEGKTVARIQSLSDATEAEGQPAGDALQEGLNLYCFWI